MTRNMRLTGNFLTVVFLALIFGVAFAQGELPELPGFQPLTSDDLNELRDRITLITTEEKPNPESPNCAIHELNAPGQGAYAQGSVGGIYVTPPIGGTPPSSIGLDIGRLDSLAGSASSKVGIIVLDHFLGGSFTVPADLYEITSQGDLETFVAKASISHGALVFNHLNSLIQALSEDVSGGTVSTDSFNFDGVDYYAVTWMVGSAELIVMAADMGLETSQIANSLNNAIGTMNEQYSPDEIAVNMSFVIIPCDILEDFQNAVDQDMFDTFEEYVIALFNVWTGESLSINDLPALLYGAHPSGVEFRRVMRFVTTPTSPGGDGDPLLNFLSEPRGNMTFVASSGNFNLPYQMYPAASPEVIGVGSLNGPSFADRSDFSNFAEVTEAGAYFTLANPSDLNQTGNVAVGSISYAGTSFAAPAVSLFSALDLAQASGDCVARKLAHHRSANPLDPPWMLEWNIKLDEAVKRFC